MIVSCPSCATHYNHPEEPPGRTGRCSRCDETFPLNGPKSRYRVMPVGASSVTDPLLATSLSETQTLVDRPDPALMPTQTLPDTVALPDPLPAAPPIDDAADDEAFFGDSLGDDEALFGIDDEAPDSDAAADEESDAEAAKAKAGTHPVRETAAVFLLAGLGAAAGYHVSTEFGFELLNAIGVGLAVGITFGWAWIRWAERKR